MIIPKTSNSYVLDEPEESKSVDDEVYTGDNYDDVNIDNRHGNYYENYPNISKFFFTYAYEFAVTPPRNIDHRLEVVLTKTISYEKLDALQYVAVYCLALGMILSVVTAAVAISTWLLIPKWRKFKNHVFLMIVLTFATLYCLFEASRTLGRAYWLVKATDFFLCACAWWLLVACVMFYMDIVKVFRSSVSKRTLKSSLLVWGVAFATTALSVADDALWGVLHPLREFDVWLVLPLVANCVMYGLVVRALLRGGSGLAARRGRAAQAATFALLLSGLVLLAAVLAAEPPAAPRALQALAQLVFVAQTVAVDVCFLILKSNREAWKGFYKELKDSLANAEKSSPSS